jgi:hypothetical protein
VLDHATAGVQEHQSRLLVRESVPRDHAVHHPDAVRTRGRGPGEEAVPNTEPGLGVPLPLTTSTPTAKSVMDPRITVKFACPAELSTPTSQVVRSGHSLTNAEFPSIRCLFRSRMMSSAR